MKKTLTYLAFLLTMFVSVSASAFTITDFLDPDKPGTQTCSETGVMLWGRTGCVTYTNCNRYNGKSGLPDPKDELCISDEPRINCLASGENCSCSEGFQIVPTSDGRKSCRTPAEMNATCGSNGLYNFTTQSCECQPGYKRFNNGSTSSCVSESAEMCSYSPNVSCANECPANRPYMVEQDNGTNKCTTDPQDNDCEYGNERKINNAAIGDTRFRCRSPFNTCVAMSAIFGTKCDQPAEGTCSGNWGMKTSSGVQCGNGGRGDESLCTKPGFTCVTVNLGGDHTTQYPPQANAYTDTDNQPEIHCNSTGCVGDDDWKPSGNAGGYTSNDNNITCDFAGRNCSGGAIDLTGNTLPADSLTTDGTTSYKPNPTEPVFTPNTGQNTIDLGGGQSGSGGTGGTGGGSTGGGSTGGGDTGGGDTGGGDTGGGDTGGGSTGGGDGGDGDGGSTGGGGTGGTDGEQEEGDCPECDILTNILETLRGEGTDGESLLAEFLDDYQQNIDSLTEDFEDSFKQFLDGLPIQEALEQLGLNPVSVIGSGGSDCSMTFDFLGTTQTISYCQWQDQIHSIVAFFSFIMFLFGVREIVFERPQ